MARIVKYLLAAVATAAVVALAVVVGRSTSLLAGALVPLAALIALTLVVRVRMDRAERSGMADWDGLVSTEAPTDDIFGEWSATAPIPDRPAATTTSGTEPSEQGVRAAEPAVDPRPEVEGEGRGAGDGATAGPAPLAEVRPTFDDEAVRSTGSGRFPFDEDDGFGDLPPFPHVDPGAWGDDALGSSADPVTDADPPPSDGEQHGSPTPSTRPVPPLPTSDAPAAGPTAPQGDQEREDAFSMAGVASSAGSSPRRSLIDWTGPTRIVEDAVRTSDDVLAASAATALPTAADDTPAPAAGSELARLLAKVEARLREYE